MISPRARPEAPSAVIIMLEMALAGSTEAGAPGAQPGARRATWGPGDTPRLVAIAAVALATLVVVQVDWDSPVRVALTLAFVLFVPGLALAELLEGDDPVQRWTLATGASLGLETLVAVTLLYAWVFSPMAVLSIAVALTCLGLLTAALRRRHGADGRAPGAPP